MIETHQIDGQLFVVSRSGRTERLLLPVDAIAEARASISDAEQKLREAARAADELRAQVDQAVFYGEDSTSIRAQLATASRESESLRAAIGGHRRNITEIQQAVDRHAAEALQRQHADHLAALTKPYEIILTECQQ